MVGSLGLWNPGVEVESETRNGTPDPAMPIRNPRA